MSTSQAQKLTCEKCGKLFISKSEECFLEQAESLKSDYCLPCRKFKSQLKKQEKDRIYKEKQKQEDLEKKKIFNNLLEDWTLIDIDDISFSSDNILYIIGNGFDIMHGVKSSYSYFRDSLAKDSPLRSTLESFLMVEDIWGNFEKALGYFDIQSMTNSLIIDNWLSVFDAYDVDDSGTNFFLAGEAAANPITTVARELPRRFRMWVDRLSIGTKDKPLKNILRKNGKVLSFNYTEFMETHYGFPDDNICYIHGSRKKKKCLPKEELILGHMPQEDIYDCHMNDRSSDPTRDPYKLAMIDLVHDNVINLVDEANMRLTKDCSLIINSKKTFFTSLSEIEYVLTVGHSFSPVDQDYFIEIISNIKDIKNIVWYFGCHNLSDLENLENLLTDFKIDKSNVFIFRTDSIKVNYKEDENIAKIPTKQANKKNLCKSDDGKWLAKTVGYSLFIVDKKNLEVNYEIIFSAYINKAFFSPCNNYLFVINYGENGGIFIFRNSDKGWEFTRELEPIPNQSLINRRLRKVFLTTKEIIFVYNNRVRKYSLIDGELKLNLARQKAKDFTYSGLDISHLLLKSR